MFDSIKKLCVAFVVLALGGRAVYGFALLGPVNEPWQTQPLGYNSPGGAFSTFGDIGIVDVGAPKNFGQGYRWNVPNVVYSYDASFLTYFGAEGQAAVDAGFAIFNSLSNVSSYSSNLAEIPLSANRYNYTAVNLNLVDLKSATMEFLIEQLGLAQPQRWVWAIHDRYTGSGLSCGNYQYDIVMRNYDTLALTRTTTPYSKYVNGTLYGYTIYDLCSLSPNPFAPLLADAVEYTPDPASQLANQPVANQYLQEGQYFIGLTRDDIMGLRYLYAATNTIPETTDPSSFLYYTNTLQPQVLVSSNYGLFLQQALTNGPGALQALYPGLIITSSNSYFGQVITTNVSFFIGRPPNGYAGEVATLSQTIYTTNYQNLFSYTFGNVVVRNTTPATVQVTQTITLGPVVNGYAGEVAFFTNSTTTYLPATNGDFYIIPAGLCGSGYYVLTNYPPVPSLIAVTNIANVSTNGFVTTQGNTFLISQQTITFFTNYSLVVAPIDCASNVTELRQGLEKIHFVRQDFDSELGQAWTPVTNIYTMIAVTNSQPRLETFIRVLNQPDIIISASDLASGPDQPIVGNEYARTTPDFNQTTNVGQFGPGTLHPYPSPVFSTNSIRFDFNNVGPQNLNIGPSFLFNGETVYSDINGFPNFVWGSFDGTTNAPTVYPNTLSIAQLEAQIYFQITTSLLPAASVSTNKVSSPYSVQLQAQSAGGPPFVWSYATNSATLSSLGFSLSTNGTISGVPVNAQGTYDFSVQAKDSTGRVTAKSLFIVIGP